MEPNSVQESMYRVHETAREVADIWGRGCTVLETCLLKRVYWRFQSSFCNAVAPRKWVAIGWYFDRLSAYFNLIDGHLLV